MPCATKKIIFCTVQKRRIMEDTLLMDAAERFAKGEMSHEEKVYFEDLRKNNPSLDQTVVEQLFFLNQLDNYANTKNIKSVLAEVEHKLVQEKFVSKTVPTQQAKLIKLWHKHKKTIAVAASIAGLVSIFVASIIASMSNKNNNIGNLVTKIDKQETETKILKNKLSQIQADVATPTKPRVDEGFRATGFMIDATNNYIATNAHVVNKMHNNLIVENKNGTQFYAKSVYVNLDEDLAIIKIIDTDFKKLPLLPYSIRKAGADIGEQIFMMGYPKPELVYSEGYISAKNGFQLDTTFCQISATANEGCSGSPVITKNGDIVGIVASKQTNANGVVFVTKSANIFRAIAEVKKLENNEKIRTTSLPSLKGLDRVTQIKKLENYVFMIKGN